MACGAPVVASRTGGLPEVVEDGKTGFLRPVGAIDEMAEAAVSILTDDARHAVMREAGLRLAHEHFSAEAIVPRYEALYERVVRGG